MKRDFSESARQELLSLVTEVENDKWCDFTDWMGDRWYDFEGWIGQLDVRDYINNVNNYHKKVIDKNNTTSTDIENIFQNVNDVSDLYKSRFIALLADLKEFNRMIKLLSTVVNPNNGKFNSEYVGNKVRDTISRYVNTSSNLEKIATDGLTEEDVKNMDQSKLKDLLDVYGPSILDNIPNVKVGDEIEVEIGPGVVVYYNVSGEVKGTGNVNLNLIAEEQQLKLKEYSDKQDLGNGISTGIVSFVLPGDNVPKIETSLEGITVSYENTIGADTYAHNYIINWVEQEIAIENSVSTDTDIGSVSSALGIKFSDDSKSRWKPLPEPVPIESPYSSHIPDFDIDWKTVGETVIVVGAITYVVVKTAAAIALIPTTGGASAVLIVV